MGTTERSSRPPGAPKGRPTPGRKQRNAAARQRARRERFLIRPWWAGGAVVLLGLVAALVVTGTGAGGTGHVLP